MGGKRIGKRIFKRMAVPLKRIRKKIALNISILNQRDLPLRSYVRCGGTLADLIRKAPPPFIPEAGVSFLIPSSFLIN